MSDDAAPATLAELDPLASLTVEDVAALLKLAPKTVRGLCKRGKLRSVTIARRVRITRAALAALLDGTTQPSPSAGPSEPAWPELPSRAPARRPRGRPRRSESTGSSASSSPSCRVP